MNKTHFFLIIVLLASTLALPEFAACKSRDNITSSIPMTSPALPTLFTSAVTSITSPSASFQGTLTGAWSGQVAETYPRSISGTFSVTIYPDGSVRGAFGGSYTGVAIGLVDQGGNLTATGTALGGTTEFTTFWQGKITQSDGSISIQGDLTGPYMSGQFSGTGSR